MFLLSVLSRLSNLMSFQQRKIFMKSFAEPQLGYYPLVGLFHGREINIKVNHIHERSLRIVYRDYSSSFFKDLLKKDRSVCIHHRIIQSLAIELFKVTENLSNTIMSDIFPTRILNTEIPPIPQNLVYTHYDILVSKVWRMIPIEIKKLFEC